MHLPCKKRDWVRVPACPPYNIGNNKMLTANEYMTLKAKGIEPFNFSKELEEQKNKQQQEDDTFELLGKIVEEHPLGR